MISPCSCSTLPDCDPLFCCFSHAVSLRETLLAYKVSFSNYSHGPHVVLWQQRDLQDLGVVVHGLVARGGHRLPCDTVDLVEGVGPQQPVVSSANEELQGQRLALHVAMKLRRENDREDTVRMEKKGKRHPLEAVKTSKGLSEVNLPAEGLSRRVLI